MSREQEVSPSSYGFFAQEKSIIFSCAEDFFIVLPLQAGGADSFHQIFLEEQEDDDSRQNGKVALVQPIAQGLTRMVNDQEGLYTLYLRGSENGEKVNRKRVISCVDACYNPYDAADWEEIRRIACSDELEYMASNTTEAGITYDPSCTPDQQPPVSFPAKVTLLLHERFLAGKPGITFLSCELIDANGQELKKDVLLHAKDWGYEEDFVKYIEEECLFCSTLVDRIVPGRIRDPKEVEALTLENGYEDDLLDVGEVFGVWYIEGPKELEEKLPFKKSGLNVHVVPEVAPYKKRKVRILNGAHTGFVLGAYLAGKNIVRECMQDETIHGFMNRLLFDEVIPILPLDKADCEHFAAAVTDRFNNPFVDHQLMSISLNSTSKWKARDLPSLLEYDEKFRTLPAALCMGFAAPSSPMTFRDGKETALSESVRQEMSTRSRTMSGCWTSTGSTERTMRRHSPMPCLQMRRCGIRI